MAFQRPVAAVRTPHSFMRPSHPTLPVQCICNFYHEFARVQPVYILVKTMQSNRRAAEMCPSFYNV